MGISHSDRQAGRQFHTALGTCSTGLNKTLGYEKFLVQEENFHHCLDK